MYFTPSMHPIHSIEKSVLFLYISLFCKRFVNKILKHRQNLRCLYLFEKGAVWIKFMNLKVSLKIRSFPSTKMIQNQESPTRKSVVFSYTMIRYTFSMFLKQSLLTSPLQLISHGCIDILPSKLHPNDKRMILWIHI